jgi:hypothetical protein
VGMRRARSNSMDAQSWGHLWARKWVTQWVSPTALLSFLVLFHVAAPVCHPFPLNHTLSLELWPRQILPGTAPGGWGADCGHYRLPLTIRSIHLT